MCNEIQARRLAEYAHMGQLYGDRDYTYHLENVVKLALQFPEVRDIGASFVEQVAWLHDILEDTHVKVRHLHDFNYNQKVIEVVELLTKTSDVSYKEYLDRIMLNQVALVVKLADTITNLQHSVMAGHNNRIKKYTNQLLLLRQVK